MKETTGMEKEYAQQLIQQTLEAMTYIESQAHRVRLNLQQAHMGKLPHAYNELRSLERQLNRALHNLDGVEQKTRNVLNITTR